MAQLTNYHADIINLRVLKPYHQQHERLFQNLRTAHEFAPEIAQQISYKIILDEDQSFSPLYEKIRSFIFKKTYEPLTVVETTIFQGAINFYKKTIEESKIELANRMIPQSVIDAYQASQQETIVLVDFVFKKIVKKS